MKRRRVRAKRTEKGKKRSASMIKIDQIRELESFVFVGSHREGNRVVLITEADAMNQPAANSLLKILEEPPSSVYFILVSSKASHSCRPSGAAAAQFPSARPMPLRGNGLAGAFRARKTGYALPRSRRRCADACCTVERAGPVGADRRAGGFTGFAAGGSDCPGGTLGCLAQRRRLFRMEHLVEGVQRWLFDLAQERMAGEVRYHKGWPRPKGVEKLDPVALTGPGVS
jgi:DNA polymerase-3 subunit delta'